MASFILSCESTVDIPYAHWQERKIPVIFYHYEIDGTDYEDDMGRDPEGFARFYQTLRNGKTADTTLINSETYTAYFEALLQESDQVLHVAFSSGLSGSAGVAAFAAEELSEQYPDKKIRVIDSLCASSGYGLLMDCAADLRDRGASMEEVGQWIMDNRKRVHHQFYSTDMTMYHRTGRVSGPAAAIGTVLNICPIMRVTEEGRLVAYAKVRGERAAIAATLKEVAAHIENGADYDGRFYICESDYRETAEKIKGMVEEQYPKLAGKVEIFSIGTIIGSHSGWGTIACFFFGDER